MSYRCNICSHVNPKGSPRLLHILYREDGNINREIPVCGRCQEALKVVPYKDYMLRFLTPMKKLPGSLIPTPCGAERVKGRRLEKGEAYQLLTIPLSPPVFKPLFLKTKKK